MIEEGIFTGRGRIEDERTLPQIVQNERGEDQEGPGARNRLAPKVAHVRVERLPARDDKKDAAHDDERAAAMAQEKGHSGERIERHEDRGMRGDVANPEDGQDTEPDEHHCAEPFADRAGALRLHREKAHQDANGQRNDERLDFRRGNEQAFHRRKDGNGGRDNAIPVEEGGARNSHHDHPARGKAVRFLPVLWKRQREKRQDSAFAVVVRAHDDGEVFYRYEREETPDDE